MGVKLMFTFSLLSCQVLERWEVERQRRIKLEKGGEGGYILTEIDPRVGGRVEKGLFVVVFLAAPRVQL